MKRRSIGRRGVLAAAGGLLAAPAVIRAQGQSAGVALVIGNSKYKWEASLPNVKRDVVDVAKRFQELGLRTELLQDVGKEAMRQAVDKFAVSARGANLAAFYFAGHGASWDSDTYLVPEDADLSNPSTVQSLLPVTAVINAMKEAKHRLLVLDNCRNNPADGWRQRTARDAAIASPGGMNVEDYVALLKEPNTLALYSTASGRIAVDGPPGQNSPFAAALLRQLEDPSIDLQALPGKLRRDLLLATQGRQLVWEHNTYTAPLLLNRAGKQAASNALPAHDPSRIVELKNAYAFARESGLVMPSGLIAYRPPAGSPHAQKIGSFKYSWKAPAKGGTHVAPALLLVISIDDDNTADAIWASKNWAVGTGAYWRFVPCTLSGDRLVWNNRTGQTSRDSFELKWRDVNSGSYSSTRDGGGAFPGFAESGPFTRLDG